LVNNSSANYATIRLASKIKNLNLRLPNGFKTCKETFATASLVVYAQKNSVLLNEINEKIELFKSIGLIEA
jgi:hypothetical protein